MKRTAFFRSVCALAIPVALQSLLQSSFSVVDQVMLGQLGEVTIAGVGFAGKFSSIFSVVASAVGAVAGIMISQYLGQRNRAEVRRSFYGNLYISVALGLVFTLLCLLLPEPIMGLYTRDGATRAEAAGYLRILSATFLPMAGATMLSTLLRCMEKARLPLYATIVSALLNTALNAVLIFDLLGFAPMGAKGAAIATAISQLVNFLLMLLLLLRCDHVLRGTQRAQGHFNWKQYGAMLLPLLICEVFWSLGENVYAAIYGHMSTEASAAMNLVNPVQGIMIGALCGLSQAAGVIIGRLLGEKKFDEAYHASKKLLLYGLCGALLLSCAVVAVSPLYVRIYEVEGSVRRMARQIMLAYAIVAPFKVLNMILGGGILRSGGRTGCVMAIDLLGTWVFGVPIGLLTAFALQLPVAWVYFFLSLEEAVRFAISLVVFHRKKWMLSLSA